MSVSSDDEDRTTVAAAVELRRQGLEEDLQNNGDSEVQRKSDGDDRGGLPFSEEVAIQPRKWGVKNGEDEVALDVLKERHRKRAERFNTSYLEPKVGDKVQLKIHKAQGSESGMETGLDIYSEEQLNKRKERALKFGVSEAPIVADALKNLQQDGSANDEEASAAERLRVQERANRFGTEVPSNAEDDDKGMAIDSLESAEPLDETADIRKEAIHVHGTDLCSTKDLINYFKTYNPKHIEWINDSSCNVVFSDENSAKRAMVGKLKDKSALERIDGPIVPTFLNFEDGEVCAAGSSGEAGAKVEIQYRYATTSDVKVFKDNYVSRRMWEKKNENKKGSGKKALGTAPLKMRLDVDLDQIIQEHRSSSSSSRYSPYDSRSSKRNQRRRQKQARQRSVGSASASGKDEEGKNRSGGDLRMILKGKAEESGGLDDSMDVIMET